jgi:two-component system cell cycle sensor histidine kinase/response regulator CckA
MTELPNMKSLWASAAIEHLFAQSGISFIIVSPEKKVVDVNDTLCELLGYTREEMVGCSVDQFTYHLDLGMTQNLFSKARQNNVVLSFEKRYVAKSGELFWFKGRSEPLREDTGEVVYRLVMLENITLKKQNELFLEQMAAIVNTSEDAIFRTSSKGAIEFWSKGAERLYGYSAEEAIGKNADLIADSCYAEEEQQAFARLMRGEVVSVPTGTTKHKDGHLINVSILIFPLRDKQGEMIAFAAVHRNVSELRHLSEQLRLSQRMETAGMLAGGIAHDFNNILTVIKGSCDVLSQEMPELLGRGRHLELIEKSAEKAASLTRQLLTFSRRQKIAPEVLNANTMLEQLRPIMQRTLGEDIALEVALHATCQIKEDPTQLEQIILNIAVNARHAMPKGGKLRIETSDLTKTHAPLPAESGWESFMPVQIDNGDYLQIAIHDEGSGMSRDVLERIFEPFFTTKAQGQGSGLGLAVVYGMVAQVKGGIQVESRLGHGSVFRIFLPKVEAEPPPQLATPAIPNVESKRGRILVVDDDNNVRGLIVRVLEFAGYQTTQAGSAEEVLENEALADVDLIVSDVVMPGLSGPEFSKLWLERRPSARFLFISGYIEDATETDILMAGNFLAKPFKPAVLLQKVEAELKHGSAAVP